MKSECNILHQKQTYSSSTPRELKSTVSTSKIMVAFFWDMGGVLHTVFLMEQPTINAQTYLVDQ